MLLEQEQWVITMARVYSELKGIEDIDVFDIDKNNINEIKNWGL